SRYLPDIPLPAAVQVEADLGAALSQRDLVVIATATAGLRDTAKAVGASPVPALLWACKGFESSTRELPHQVVAAALPRAHQVAALSGPSFALEVARGQPTALVCASRDAQFASSMAAALNSSRVRIYSSTDVAGVEL